MMNLQNLMLQQITMTSELYDMLVSNQHVNGMVLTGLENSSQGKSG